MIAEGAGILERLTPPRGDSKHWREQAASFRSAAGQIVNLADRRDYPGARRAVEELGNRCAACHKQHR
jgi:cytochrome c556